PNPPPPSPRRRPGSSIRRTRGSRPSVRLPSHHRLRGYRVPDQVRDDGRGWVRHPTSSGLRWNDGERGRRRWRERDVHPPLCRRRPDRWPRGVMAAPRRPRVKEETRSPMARTNPPFRADHVGSLLRPPELIEARDAHLAGRIPAEALREAEDKAIRDVVAL